MKASVFAEIRETPCGYKTRFTRLKTRKAKYDSNYTQHFSVITLSICCIRSFRDIYLQVNGQKVSRYNFADSH